MGSYSLLAALLLGIFSMASASLLNCNCEAGPPGPPGPRGPPGLIGGGGGGMWGYPHPPFNPNIPPMIGPRGLPGPPGAPGYCFPCPYGGGIGPGPGPGPGPGGFPFGGGPGGGGAFGQGIASAIGNIIIIPSGINGRAQLFRITPDGQLIRIDNSQTSLNEILPSNLQDLMAQQQVAVPTTASLTGITPPSPTIPTPDDQPEGLDEAMFAVAAGNMDRKNSLRANSDVNDWRRVLLLGEPVAAAASAANSASSAEQSNANQLESSMDSFQRALVDLRDKYASLIQPPTNEQRYAVIL